MISQRQRSGFGITAFQTASAPAIRVDSASNRSSTVRSIWFFSLRSHIYERAKRALDGFASRRRNAFYHTRVSLAQNDLRLVLHVSAIFLARQTRRRLVPSVQAGSRRGDRTQTRAHAQRGKGFPGHSAAGASDAAGSSVSHALRANAFLLLRRGRFAAGASSVQLVTCQESSGCACSPSLERVGGGGGAASAAAAS